MLPDVIAGLASILCIMLLLKYWKPKSTWHFSNESKQTIETDLKYSRGEVVRAWSPFIVMTIMIIAWGLQPVKDALNSIGTAKLNISGLQNAIVKADGAPLVTKPFDFNYLSSSGTALLLAGIISLPLIGMGFKKGLATYFATIKHLGFPIITIASVVGFAFVANNSGMSTTIAMALAGTGILFPFFSPILGWLGVFLTGSDTSSNAFFCKMQHTSANAIGVDPVVTVAANVSGGVTGKMISPQSIAIGTAAVGLIGKEADLFRFTVKHSFIMLSLICIITILQAYIITWIIPSYKIIGVAKSIEASNISRGFVYLLGLAILLLFFTLTVFIINRRKSILYK
jgi:lactate permease